MKTYSPLVPSRSRERNEAPDLTVPKFRDCHAGLFALPLGRLAVVSEIEPQHFLAPAIYRDLSKLAEAVKQGQSPEALAARARRVRSQGVL